MNVNRAIDQISEIHEHLARAELYRGYRSAPVAISGIVGILAALFQSHLAGESAQDFVRYWLLVGPLAAMTSMGEIAYHYLRNPNASARKKTRTVIWQFFPCLLAGFAVTVIFYRMGDSTISLLPGTWALLFALGIFSSRPYLPRMIGFVAMAYLVGGSVLLTMAIEGTSLSPWGMGIVFGGGQLLSAIILYWNLER
ncbi:MAG: hypothetical protein KC917_20440 [Candidatus Omnitrophica bacterium]|nr:hypothetical protein [Candidatus Omnitrophota bacterium]MCA9418656.1 hypothetical protein [Candidatus Omnitrophota bacterium]MCA9433943.1 hypothetical protein [Candidatus Omnitrophota bacterium]MCA9443966.1 hypothetical protein [Candidatus Omnitrophota bacterium]